MSNTLKIAASLVALALSPAAMAEKLEITGTLINSTCVVDPSGVTVAMGNVDVSSVNAATRAGMKNFSIQVDCSAAGTDQDVSVRFGGTPDGSTGNLALSTGSTATNVGVALYDAAGNHQQLGADPTHWVTIATGTSGQLDYTAWYSSPGKNATAGSADASGDFVLLYK